MGVRRLSDIVRLHSGHSSETTIKVAVVKPVPITNQSNMIDHGDVVTRSPGLMLQNLIDFGAKTWGLVRLKRYPENLVARRHAKLRQSRARQGWLTYALTLAIFASGMQGILPIGTIFSTTQASVLQHANAGYAQLNDAENMIKNQQFDSAKPHFAKAEIEFNDALAKLRGVGQASSILPFLVDDAEYSSAQALLESAALLASAGQTGSDLGQLATTILNTNNSDNSDPFAKVSGIFKQLLTHQKDLIKLADQITIKLETANRRLTLYADTPVTNSQLESVRSNALSTVPVLWQNARKMSELLRHLDSILGGDVNRRYLLLFLNNTELRPGGGFIGSFATFLVQKGQIASFDVNTNIYKLDNAFTNTTHVDPPYPINQLLKDWALRDANWDTSFEGSANKVAWFYKQEAGVDVDGVLSIDTSFIQSLLQFTGPVKVPSQNMTLDKDNVVGTLQYKSEKEYLENPAVRALNEPKKAIADAFPYLLTQVFSQTSQHSQGLADILQAAVAEKHLLFSTNIDQVNGSSSITKLAAPFPTQDDFLMITNGNLGGLKSSLNIKQNVDISISPTNHQTFLHTIDIARTHNGSYNWPDGDNRNFIRLSVPKNAVYLTSSSTGLDGGVVEPQAYIEQLNDYQAFGHWLTTPVGATKMAHFEYETPIEKKMLQSSILKFHYLKQPGWTYDNLKVNFINTQKYQFLSDQLEFKQRASRDLFWLLPMKNTSASRIGY